MALQAGEIIEGKYRIVCLLGEGGMGAVYEGENTRIKRKVAIKVLHAAVAEKTDVVQRFEREAQAAGRIGSEHIVEVLDLGNLPTGERFMVMEYLDGEDLTGRIKSKKALTAAEAAPICHQVLEGLAAAHEADIIHRDLKPDNIFILSKKAGRTDFVKILDFGVSKFSALDTEMSMTRTGAVMGTPYYMSPEQAKGGKVDARSDLYAIGVVLYQMVTGRVPFNASSFNELLFKIALESPEPVEKIVPNIPPDFAAIITKAMDRNPDERYQSAKQFQQAVEQWMAMGQSAQAGAAAGLAPTDPTSAILAQSSPGLTPSTPGLSASSPGMSQSGPDLSASGSGPQLAMGTPVPAGTGTPIPGSLGASQVGVALTPQQTKRKSTAVALVVVIVAILGVGGVGAYMLVEPPPSTAAGPQNTSTAANTVQTAAPSTTAETATTSVTAVASATESAEPPTDTTTKPADSTTATASASIAQHLPPPTYGSVKLPPKTGSGTKPPVSVVKPPPPPPPPTTPTKPPVRPTSRPIATSLLD